MKLFTIVIFLSCFACCRLHTKTNSIERVSCPVIYDTLFGGSVCTFVDSMPKFKSGNQDVLKYILSNFDLKTSNEFETSFNLYFIVDVNGAVKYPRIKNKKAKELNENEIKLLEIISKMPNWKSGKCNNVKVPVLLYLPIKI